MNETTTTKINDMHRTLKPYLINAFYSWCIDVGYTPLILAKNSNGNSFPKTIVDSKALFDIHPSSVRNLLLGKNNLEFEAFFNGNREKVSISYDSILKAYAKENHYGLDFDEDCDSFDSDGEFQKFNKKPKFMIIKNDDR